ncbi:uncharacterized protein PAC_14064 [Phialocephala subalpina]|uniref:Major facilitator superfamily (MFS) profile domain-containing protein n=1 Tax=Phialocephala subalpina TaxID=576137 RepID=A0A1L7XGU0_9HELO|nr:uncharacterized protein PAC_14064 [Phialocephala subalpina]
MAQTEDIEIDALSARDSPLSASLELRPVTRQRQIVVLLSGFFTVCLVVGINQSYGVFQGYYTSSQQTMLPPSQNSGALLALVGTLGAGLTWGGSIAVNPLLSLIDDKKFWILRGRQCITLSGVLLMSLGFLLASLSSQIWHLLLTQGLLYRIGSSILYFPILSTAPEYFTSHRGSALVRNYASVNGFMYFMRGLGAVVGGPAGGNILGVRSGLDQGRWKGVVWFDAALLVAATVCVGTVRVGSAVERKSWVWKA